MPHTLHLNILPDTPTSKNYSITYIVQELELASMCLHS